MGGGGKAGAAGRAALAGLGLFAGGVAAYAVLRLITPSADVPKFPFADKVYHVAAFGALTLPGALALPRAQMWFWAAFMTAFAAGMEWVQAADARGRTASVEDFLAGAVGVALAVIAGQWLRARIERGGTTQPPGNR